MLKELTCIICPNGCGITVELEGEEGRGKIRAIKGALCPKGRSYAEQELKNPQRNISTSVLVRGGVLPLASVRLTNSIPKDRIFDAVKAIKDCALTAPVQAGRIAVHNLLGYDTDVIVTKSVAAAEQPQSEKQFPNKLRGN